MSTLRAIVVDDENLARRGLTLRLANIPAVELVAECSNGAEALKAIAELSPDLVFLDIQMPGMNGFDVIEHLQSDNMPMIVFVTAFDEFAGEYWHKRRGARSPSCGGIGYAPEKVFTRALYMGS